MPAFPSGVVAARVVTRITQAGALGDPYGSGTRTIWWVYGVGPVKIEFDHAGGGAAPVTIAELQSTSLTPLPAAADDDFFPLAKGTTLAFRWTNTKHLRSPEVRPVHGRRRRQRDRALEARERHRPDQGRRHVRLLEAPRRADEPLGQHDVGVEAAFPPLGPAGAPAAQRNHFVTALDLFTFGINPILTPYPAVGDHWASSRRSDDFATYGVDGQTRITGMQPVTVPAGTIAPWSSARRSRSGGSRTAAAHEPAGSHRGWAS